MSQASRVFICFSSKDEAIARKVVDFLEAEGLKCWLSSRDVPPGQNYQETIVAALEKAPAVVFLFSESSSTSGEIRKELSLAGSFNAPVFPLRLSAVTPTGALRYELATRQWIDMFPDPEQALRTLAAAIATVLNVPRAHRHSAAAEQASTKSSAATRPPVLTGGSQEFEAIRLLLARHIGPIAKVFVQKAAAEANTLNELCEKLALNVDSPSERAAFLQAARARLAIK